MNARGTPPSFPRLRKLEKPLGVRIPAALLFLFGARVGHLTERPNETTVVLLAYLAITVALALGKEQLIERRAFRLLGNAVDVVAITALIRLIAPQHRAWLLLLDVFPITAVSRYLRKPWGILLAVFAAAGYRWATVDPFWSTIDLGPSAAVTAILAGVALNADKLARSRERFENAINTLIDSIYDQLLTNHPLKGVMQSILDVALKVTRSDVTAILLGESAAADFFATKRDSARVIDFAEIERIVRTHYESVRQAPQGYISLVKYPSLSKLLGKNAIAAPPWAGRLISITIGSRFLGVIGVFSHRSVHYTADDIEKLKSLRALVAIAQQNAPLSHDLKSNLALLYKIGEQLQQYEGSTKVYQDIVQLVAQHVGSEEAALFIHEEREQTLKKVAVAGPDEHITAKLLKLETTEATGSLTATVFERKEAILNNDIPSDEPHAQVYSKELPSGITKHYMGAPIVIGSTGDKPLGVIRVLNKRSWNYKNASGLKRLHAHGFGAGDLALLSAIATYIAGAMRNVMYLETSQHFRDLIYKSPDHIMVIDSRGYVQNFNHECEEIWGITEEQARGRHVTEFYASQEEAEAIGEALDDAPDHVIHSHESYIRVLNDEVIPVRLSATLLFDNDGNRVGSIGVFKDARPMIRAENERLKREKLATLGAIAQTTGHDMKHDIGTILGYARMLQDSDLDSSQRDEIHGEIAATARDLLNKVQNMLMTAKPRLPEMAVVSISSLMEDFEASVASRAALSSIEFAVTRPGNDILVLADAEQMRQVFANLFGNSTHAIAVASERDRRKGRITFSAAVADENVRFQWCDNGAGMKDEVLANLFSPFVTTKKEGTGLGLFITKTIIGNHQGTIMVESTSPNGTCFEIVLPLFRDEADGR